MDNSFEIFWGLQAIADGKFQGWNTLWHTTIFLNNGLCLHPGKSLVVNIGHDGTGTNCHADSSFFEVELADEVLVEPIPLENNEDIMLRYLSMQKIKTKCLFLAKHYLRYIIYNTSDALKFLRGDYLNAANKPTYVRLKKPESVLTGIHHISFVIFPHFIPIFF